MSQISVPSGNIFIKQNNEILQYSTNNTTYTNISLWPLTIINSNPTSNNVVTVYITNNLTITDKEQYFIIGSNYICFNGYFNTLYNKITISISGTSLNNPANGYNGLIQNGKDGIIEVNIDFSGVQSLTLTTIPSNGYSNISIENINILTIIDLDNNICDYLNIFCGWLCQTFFGYNATNNTIYNCSSISNTPTINNNGYWIGLIAGTFCNFSSIINCNTNNYINTYSGGILGSYSKCNTMTNCYSTGDIDSYSGGLIGCFFNSSININNCFSTGKIIRGVYSGGIIANDCGYNTTSIINISACYSLCKVTDIIASGILGASIYYNYLTNTPTNIPSNKPTINISNCYTTLFIGESNPTYYFVSKGLLSYITLNLNINTCYYIDFTTNYEWSDTNAQNKLNSTPLKWIFSNTGLPYILKSFEYTTPVYITPNNIPNQCIYVGTTKTLTLNYIGSTPINCNWYINGVLIDNEITNSYTITNAQLSDDAQYTCILYNNVNYIKYNFYLSVVPTTYTILTTSGNNIHIKQNGSNIEYSYDNGTFYPITNWPVIMLTSSTIYLYCQLYFINDITITDSNQYFIFGTTEFSVSAYEGIVNIILNCPTYDGLLQNGTATKNGFDSGLGRTISNINITGTTILNNYGGFLCQKYFGKNVYKNTTIRNCSSNINISSDYSGGLIGAYSRCNINNCYTTGNITGNYAGGIIGAYYSSKKIDSGLSDNSIIYNIYSTGNILGNNSGGIFGSFSTTDDLFDFYDIFTNGNIIGNNSGGIFGSDFGFNNSNNLNIQNMYTLGNISNNSGGIFGGLTIPKQKYLNLIINQCYTYGTFNNNNGLISPSMISSVTVDENNSIYYISNNNWSNTDASTILSTANYTTYIDNIPYILLSFTPLYNNISTPVYITSISSSQILIVGQTLNIQVLANGYGTITYQWQFSNNGGISYSNIINATNNEYILSNITLSNKGLYRCIATNSVNIVTSLPISVNILSSTNPTISNINPLIGSIDGNTTVTITGTNFSSTNIVKFGTTLATQIFYINSTKLNVISPAKSSGVYNISVTNTLNEVSPTTTSSLFTYIELPSTPINVIATPNNSRANISWDALSPDENIIYYTIYCSDTNISSINSSTNSVSFENLINDVSYTFTVSATNNNGTGLRSISSNSITPRNNPNITSIFNTTNINYQIIGTSNTNITISGSNFYNPSITVKSSDNSIILNVTNIVVVNTSTITCSIQNNLSGIFTFYISDIGGTITFENGFTFYNPPTITNINPNQGTSVGTTLLTINGTNLINIDSITFDDRDINTFSYTSNTITFNTLSKNTNNNPLISIDVLGTVIKTNLFSYIFPPTINQTDATDPSKLIIDGNNLNNSTVNIGETQVSRENIDETINKIIINNYNNQTNAQISISTIGGIILFTNTNTSGTSTYTSPTITSITN